MNLLQKRRNSGFLERIDQAGAAAQDVLFGFQRCDVCHISSAQVFEGLKHSRFFWQFRALFKAIFSSSFSSPWVHCSYLPVAFEAFL